MAPEVRSINTLSGIRKDKKPLPGAQGKHNSMRIYSNTVKWILDILMFLHRMAALHLEINCILSFYFECLMPY